MRQSGINAYGNVATLQENVQNDVEGKYGLCITILWKNVILVIGETMIFVKDGCKNDLSNALCLPFQQMSRSGLSVALPNLRESTEGVERSWKRLMMPSCRIVWELLSSQKQDVKIS
jgi:hypothetical protein